jgi:hypothetical protein
MANSTTNIDTISASQASKEVTANAYFDAASGATLFGRRASTSSALTWGYYGGNFVTSAGALSQIANGTVALTASQTNYIVASKSAGAVSTSTATTNWNDTANYHRLYSVVTGASSVTSYTDSRQLATLTGAANLAAVPASLIPSADDTYDLGSASFEWRNLYVDGTANIDSLVADTADINAGTIDATAIGATTPSTGAFTTLGCTGNATIGGDASTNQHFIYGDTNINLAGSAGFLIYGTTTDAPCAIMATDANTFDTPKGVLAFGGTNAYSNLAGSGTVQTCLTSVTTKINPQITVPNFFGYQLNPQFNNSAAMTTLRGCFARYDAGESWSGAHTNYYQFQAAGASINGSATGTLQDFYAYRADDVTVSTSIITGLRLAFNGRMSSGTGKWNTYNNGTALNYMNGALLLGTTTDDTVSKLQVNGGMAAAGTITTPGTTGAVTINKPVGRVNIAAAGTAITVTNSLVTANSIVMAVCATNDATAQVKNVVAAAGSFTINLAAAATSETAINFTVHNVI